MPAVQTVKPRLLSEIKDKEKQPDPADDEEDLVLREALEASRSMIESDDSALQHALRMSLEGYFSFLKIVINCIIKSIHGNDSDLWLLKEVQSIKT